MTNPRAPLVLLVAFGLGLGCATKGKKAVESRPVGAASASAAAAPTDVVATVNGAPITESEVQRELTSSHGRMGDRNPERAKSALEDLIREELASQKATALGLDSDPGYQQQVRRLEAEIRSVKRRALADVYYRTQMLKGTEIPESEIRAYFDKNQARLRAEVHIFQILVRSAIQAKELDDRLKKGEAFDVVAKGLFPEMPGADRKPWDLGFLAYNQVPEPWRTVVYDLKPGQVSDVLAGPNERYWILKVVERRDKPDFTYELAKPTILSSLRAQKTESRHAELDSDLRKDAKIEYLARPPQPTFGEPMPPFPATGPTPAPAQPGQPQPGAPRPPVPAGNP